MIDFAAVKEMGRVFASAPTIERCFRCAARLLLVALVALASQSVSGAATTTPTPPPSSTEAQTTSPAATPSQAVTPTAVPPEAAPFLQLMQAVSGLTPQIQDKFDDPKANAALWTLSSVGALIRVDSPPAPSPHALSLTYNGLPVWWMLRSDIGDGMFGAGNDTINFSDSTDILATVYIRLDADAVAWLGVRATPFIVGHEAESYRLELQRSADGSVTASARYYSIIDRIPINQIVLAEPVPEWIPVQVVAVHDQVAFFANGQFITAASSVIKLGGTVALGVDKGTADFTDLTIQNLKS